MERDGELVDYASAARPTPDFDAFFVERYGPLARSLGLAFGDREAAADAVQEAFLRAYTRWWRVKRLDDPAGWVRRVAINLLVDQTRRAAPRERALAKMAALTPTVAAAPSFGEDSGVIDRLAALPTQQRIAVCLFYLDDLSVAEVATAMGISAGAVKYHLNQGRNALRTVLGGDR